VQNKKAHEHSHHGHTHGLSEPGRADMPFANLTPASGRQDHTTSPSAATSFVNVSSDPLTRHLCSALQAQFRADAARVHRIPPRVRDDRETPLWGAGRRGMYY
jgi:hypothetical protein